MTYTTPSPYLGIYQVLPANVETTFYTFASPTSPPDTIHVLSYQAYDTYGNPTLTLDVGSLPAYTLATESFLYDDMQRQVTHTDAKGVQITLSFDALKRLISKTVANQNPTAFVYDVPGQPNALGRLCHVSASDGTTYTCAYDASGNQIGMSMTEAGTTYAFQKAYSLTKQLQQLTYPDGAVLTYQYNAGGQLVAMTLAESGAPAQTYAKFGQFTAFGEPQIGSYGNGVHEVLTYNVLGQLLSQAITGPGSTSLFSTTLQWNALNALQTVADQLDPPNTHSFTYDAVGRLTNATGDYPAQTFTYDDAGNLTLKGGVTHTYQGYQIQQGTQGRSVVFSAQYDADGNMTAVTRQGVTTTLSYDDERRLVQADGCTFSYDYTGQRLSKQVANGSTTYYVAPYYEVVVLPNGGGTQHTKYVLGPRGRVAAMTTIDAGTGNPSGNPYRGVPVAGEVYFHKNHLNSTIMQTDAKGDVATSIEYLPYGELCAITGPDTVRSKFTEKEYDAETGFYYFNARYYDPTTGRFITADDRLGGPLYRPDVFNRYAYVLNSPTNYVDPTEHSVGSDITHWLNHDVHDVGHFFSHDFTGFFTQDVK